MGINPTVLEARVGRTLTVRVGLENLTDTLQTLQLAADGVPSEWLLFSEEVVTLSPRERFVIQIEIWPAGQRLSGSQALGILGYMADDHSESITLHATLNFPIVEKFEVEMQSPSTLRHGKLCRVQVSNQGNTDSEYEVTFEPEEEVTWEATSAEPFAVAAGSRALQAFKLKAQSRPFFGKENDIPFVLIVTSPKGQKKRKYGTLNVPPFIPIWLPFVTIFVILGLIISLFPSTFAPPPYRRPAYTDFPARGADCDESRVIATYPSVIVATPRVEAADSAIEVGEPVVSAPDVIVEGAPTVEEAPPSVAAPTPYQFLDLPFPYNGTNDEPGGTAEQFRLANRSSSNGGRINSYFDHFYPLYPAPTAGNVTQGKEDAEPLMGGHVLPYFGSLRPTSYSGHPGIDYSPVAYDKPTTPILAAASGTILDAKRDETSGGLFIWIEHEIPDVGKYLTAYWHLEDDTYFQEMRGRRGQRIEQGERIGTMGNTGYSTGRHLHFEVRFDADRNGRFDKYEKVDPFGFIPSAEYPFDPWAENSDKFGYTNAGMVSRYLWIHPMGGFSGEIPSNGGGIFPSGGTGGTGGAGEAPSGCAPSRALPRNGTINWVWAPDPEPTAERAGLGQGCALSVFDEEGTPVKQFNKPIRIELPYADENLLRLNKTTGQMIPYLEESTLQIWWKSSEREPYKPLETTLTTQEGTGKKFAIAYTEKPGHCALMGTPIADFVAPESHISVRGDAFDAYSYLGDVVVFLSSRAPDLAKIEYSLNSGETWDTYTDPLVIKAGESPPRLNDDLTEGLPADAEGLHLLLVAAIDESGNREEPPNSKLIIIDPNFDESQRVVPSPCCDD